MVVSLKWAALAGCTALTCLAGASEAQSTSGSPQYWRSNVQFAETVNFGAKTLVGAGGAVLTYMNPALMASRGASAITSEKDQAGTTVSIFTVDERGMLVPKNGAGAYESLWVSSFNGPYTLVVSDGALSETVTIPDPAVTWPARADVREMTSAANGCSAQCAVTNPDAASLTHQLEAILSLTTGGLTTVGTGSGGGTVYCRSGYLNPSDIDLRIRAPANANTIWGTGITVTSEVQDATLDANGNPSLKHGCKIGRLLYDAAVSGDIQIPITFDHVWFYRTVTTDTSALLGHTTSSSYGDGLTNSRMELGTGVTSVTPMFQHNGGGTVVHGNHFIQTAALNGGAAVTPRTNASGHYGVTVTDNVFEGLWDDEIDIYGGGNDVERNTAFNFQFTSGNHPDGMQVLGTDDGTNTAFGTVADNYTVRGYQPTAGALDAQGIPFIRPVGGVFHSGTFSSITATGNINNGTLSNGMYFTNTNNILATNNINLVALRTANTAANPMTITTPAGLAAFEGTASGTVLTVTAIDFGTALGPTSSNLITGGSGLTGTVNLISQASGPTGGLGTYNLSRSETGLSCTSSVPCYALSTLNGGTNGTFTNNIENATTITLLAGTVVTTPSNLDIVVTPATSPDSVYTPTFPNYVGGDNPNLTSRAKIQAFWAPLAGGPAENGDGTYKGPLFPVNNHGVICKNTNAVFNPATICSAAP